MSKNSGGMGEIAQPDAEYKSDAGRRLNDKILSAFTHAYAIGEVEVAESLRAVLVLNIDRQGRDGAERSGVDPQGVDPLCQADLWVRFVEARNRYKDASDGKMATADKALEAMKEAYRQWSLT